MGWWRQRGLRFKIALGVSLTLLLVLGALVTAAGLYFRSYLQRQEQETALQVNAAFLADVRSEMLVNDWDRIQEKAEELGKEQQGRIEDISIFTQRQEGGVLVVERTVLILFATGFPGGRTINRASVELKEYSVGCAECHSWPAEKPRGPVFVDLEGQQVLRTGLGLSNDPECQTCHGSERGTLGMVLVDYNLNRYQQTAQWTAIVLGLGGLVAIVLALVALYVLMNRLVVRPLRGVVASTQAIARGNWEERLAVRSGDEVGKMSAALNEMTDQLASAYTELQKALIERGAQAAELQRALDEVQHSHAAQAHLLEAIREMSTPVVPILRGILVMPLVGVIDSVRAQNILSTLLDAVEKEHPRVIILDITGVPMVDTAVAQALLQAAQAVRLLGADVVLVGLRPQVAETVVALGVDLSTVVTRADLQGGLEYALRQLRPAG